MTLLSFTLLNNQELQHNIEKLKVVSGKFAEMLGRFTFMYRYRICNSGPSFVAFLHL